MGLPEGRVTFLFTDIEGSTRLLHEVGEAYPALLARHHEILQAAIDAHDGHVMGTEGDAFAVAFHRPEHALAAALDAQLSLLAEPWPEEHAVRVRMGIHTGPVVRNDTGYVGMALHETARLSSCAHGAQVVVSAEAERLALDVPPGTSFTDLGRHRLKDLPEAVQIFQLSHPQLPATFPPLRALPEISSNLPSTRTTFLGRTSELNAVRQGLQNSRVVTIVGPGGAGKTRLAIEAAEAYVAAFRDSVWFVDLVGASNTDAVHTAWADAFELRPEADPARTIVDYVTRLEGIVVVDNCEHVIDDAADMIDRVVATAPHVRVVATSREPLRLVGEVTVPVGPLDPVHARELFVRRAADAQPGYAPSGDELDAIDHLCASLDHLPLALELAAARVGVLGVREIAAHLDDRFRLLSSTRRGGAERHRTLHAAIDWSYNLLPDEAQALFRRVSVLPRGFTVEAAAVAGAEQMQRLDAADILQQLVDKSLLAVQHNATGARFAMLESIESFARERLREADEEAEAWERVLEWTLAIAAAFEAGYQEQGWRDHLTAVRTAVRPIRAAIAWAAGNGRRHDALRLIGHLHRFWSIDDDYLESLRLCRAVTDRWDEGTPATLDEARALVAVAHAQSAVSVFTRRALDDRRRALVAAQPWVGHGDVVLDLIAMSPWPVEDRAPTAEELRAVEARLEQGTTAFVRGDTLLRLAGEWRDIDAEHADALAEQATAIADELDHDLLHHITTYLAPRAEFERGELATHAQRALEFARRLGAPLLIDASVSRLGRVLMMEGQLEAADPYLAESEEFCRRTGDRDGLAEVVIGRARLKTWVGDHDAARAFTCEGLELIAEADFLAAARTSYLTNLATVLLALGELDDVAELVDQVTSLLDEVLRTERGDEVLVGFRDLEGALARERGDWAGSEAAHRMALDAAERHSYRERAIRQVVVSFGILAARREPPDFKRATTLLGAAGPSWARFTPFRFRLDESVEACRSGLGEVAFARAWAEGEAMPLDAAAALARQPL